jgi:hypothetical protein
MPAAPVAVVIVFGVPAVLTSGFVAAVLGAFIMAFVVVVGALRHYGLSSEEEGREDGKVELHC